MFLATKHLLAAWGHGISGTHSFSIDQSMRVAREKGLYFSNVWVVIVAQLVFCYSDRESLGPRSRRVRANIPFFALGLPFPAMLLESRVPGLVKEYLDTILPEQAQVVTHALFVAAPSIFLSGFFPAWSVLKIVCEVIVWLVLVTIALVVLAIETAVYASTLLLVASAWAFVYRDVARYVLLRSSSKYRSTMRAREVEHLAHNYFILDDRFRALQAQLDMLLPEEDQSSLQISVPFDALDMFDKKNAALWAQEATYYSTLADSASRMDTGTAQLAPSFRALSRLFDAEHKAALSNPREQPLSHFFSTAYNLSALLTKALPLPPLFRRPLAHRPPLLRLLLPFLLTYPGYFLFEYLTWCEAYFCPNLFTFKVDTHSNDPHRKALATAVTLTVNVASEARAKKAEVAAHRAILDAVLDWKNRKNALEIQRLKQD